NQARVARSTCHPTAAARRGGCRIIAARRHSVVYSGTAGKLGGLPLPKIDEGSTDANGKRGFDGSARRQICHALVRPDVLGPAIRISGVIDGVDADENVTGA